MAELPRTIVEAAAWLRGGRVSSAELTRACLERAHAEQSRLAAFVTIMDAPALAAAGRADAELRGGLDRGPLHGVPLGVKDILATVDAPTTANGRALDPGWGRDRDAEAVRRLREAGAVLVGKLALHEFAIGAPDPAIGSVAPRNPWDATRSPGGSSSGTAVAVSAGLVIGGLGTDTGGSIRQPSALCGIAGLKPTTGLVSAEGVVPLAPSLDCVGPMARTAADCALILEAIAGVPPAARRTLRGARVGVAETRFLGASALDPEIAAAIRSAVALMADHGAEVVPVELPDAEEASAANTILLRSEALAYHHDGLRRHPERYGRWMREAVLVGALFDSRDLANARRLRPVVAALWDRMLAGLDVLVAPTVTRTAAPMDRRPPPGLLAGPSFTNMWSFAGFPAASVPCGVSRAGLPIGMQMIGRPFGDAHVLAVADAYERAAGREHGLHPGTAARPS